MFGGLLLGWVLLETTDTMLNSRVGVPASGAVGAVGRGTLETTTTSTSVRDSSGGRYKASSVIDAGNAAIAKKAADAVAVVVNSQPAGDTIHSVITSSGSGYQNWQGRIMYGTYKLVQKMPGGEKLTGFTRIMHRVHVDECMDEIPTFHATPLHPECDGWCDFPVADRPNAIAQWVAHVKANSSELKGAWVAILECDYVWMKPLAAPGDAFTSTVPGRQFHFGYIQAQHPNCKPTIERLLAGNGKADDVPNSGPAPALLRFSELETVAPAYERLTLAIENDKEAVKLLGWVREMYAWDMALVQAKVPIVTEDALVSRLIIQPPSDHKFGEAAMAHYTWGAVYNDSTHTVWSWDKRVYTDQAALAPKPIPMPPAWEEGKYHLQEFFGMMKVPQEQHETLAAMLGQMNKAIETLPDLTEKFNALLVH